MKRILVPLSALAVLVASFSSPPVVAAGGGQAYDEVIKFAMNTAPADVVPGDFATDYATAAKPAAQHGGLFGGIQNAMGGVAAMMKNGMAERHYIVAGLKERTDSPAQQTATIVDCRARTRTTLDLAKKTYKVESLDASPAPAEPAHRGGPNPTWTDDGSKLAITVVNRALGSKEVSGETASGYASDITMVATKANGDSSTTKMLLDEYLSSTPEVTQGCAVLTTSGSPGAGAQAQLAFVMGALNSKSSRFTISSSGPKLPSNLLALFAAMSFSGGGRGGSSGAFTVVIERGGVRSIGADDPVFSVPADFTKIT